MKNPQLAGFFSAFLLSSVIQSGGATSPRMIGSQ